MEILLVGREETQAKPAGSACPSGKRTECLAWDAWLLPLFLSPYSPNQVPWFVLGVKFLLAGSSSGWDVLHTQAKLQEYIPLPHPFLHQTGDGEEQCWVNIKTYPTYHSILVS